MHDYKFLRLTVMIYATIINTQTALMGYTISSASQRSEKMKVMRLSLLYCIY